MEQQIRAKYNELKAIAPAGKEFFLLSGTDVTSMNSKGETKVTPVIADAFRICRAFGGDAMILGLTTIERYDF